MKRIVRLTLAHKPDIGLGAIALIVRIENAENTFGHLVRILRASTWWRRKICKTEQSEERREKEQANESAPVLGWWLRAKELWTGHG